MTLSKRRLWANDVRALLPNPLTRVDLSPFEFPRQPSAQASSTSEASSSSANPPNMTQSAQQS
jgi:hypothetical protein